MTVAHAIFLFAAAMAGGALNSVAGGGSFIAFPALMFTGVPAVNANATNTVALWPGTAASTAAYFNVLKPHKSLLVPLMITGVIGGLTGAYVLIKTPEHTFLKLVPWLMLFATLMLLFSPRITKWVRSRHHHEHAGTGKKSNKLVVGTAAIQLAIGVYIGYFGGGAGIVMMALFAILGVESIHAINGLKTTMATVVNGMALIIFILSRAVWWPQASIMIVGGAVGGYGGAWLAQRIEPRVVRIFAIATGFSMTGYFFVKAYLRG
jgi:uncharacterized membrane protein YfcA